MLVVYRFGKVTNNSIVQSAGSINDIGVGSNDDRGYRVPGLHQVSVEFDPAHRRHVNVSDQHGSFPKTRGREEIGRTRKSLDAVALRSQEPSHRLAKELIILNDRHQ
jgi:hypothetical protein